MTSDQRPSQRAYEKSLWPSFPEVVSGLREILGVRLVAYIGGAKAASSVTAWADGAAEPSERDHQRLRHAFRAAWLLQERYDSVTIQTWFKGMNPSLNDNAPAQTLRKDDPLKTGREVIAAATSFVNETGHGLSIREVAARLIAGLGPTLVAAVAGSTDSKEPKGWARYDGPQPDREAARRLVFAYEQWRNVAEAEGEGVARAWFIGSNPWLSDDTPITAIREGRTGDVRRAVKALMDDAWSG